MAEQGVQASGYFGPVIPKDPNEDIVARSRAGRDRKSGGRSRRRPRDIWAVRYALDNTLPLLLALVLACGAGAVGVMAWSWTLENRDVPAAAAEGGPAAAVVLDAPRPQGVYRAGGDLNAVERLVAARFGRPHYLGDGGLPVIEVYHTGQIREMTEFEANFPSSQPLPVDYADPPDPAPALRRYNVPDRDYPGIYFHPGPNGYGVWWHDPARDSLVSRVVVVDRGEWESRQIQRLGEALPALEELLLSFQDTDLASWDQDWAVSMQRETERLAERFVAGKHDEWAMVPYQYSCSIERELEITAGVTRGCPSPVLEQALSYLWARYGKVVHSLWALSRVHHPDSAGYYTIAGQSAGVYFTRYAERLLEESRYLTASFRDVVHISASEGFDFAALSWLGYPEVLLDTRYSVDY